MKISSKMLNLQFVSAIVSFVYLYGARIQTAKTPNEIRTWSLIKRLKHTTDQQERTFI